MFTKMDDKQKIWISYKIELFIVLKKFPESAYKNWLRELKGESTRSEDDVDDDGCGCGDTDSSP